MRPRPLAAHDEVGRLHRPPARTGEARDPGGAARLDPAVGVEDHHRVGGIGAQVIAPEGERVTLAAPGGVKAFDHFRPGGTRDTRGLVRAVVGNDEDARGRRGAAHVRDGLADPRAFVMRRDQDGEADLAPRPALAPQRAQAQRDLKREPAEQERGRQAHGPLDSFGERHRVTPSCALCHVAAYQIAAYQIASRR